MSDLFSLPFEEDRRPTAAPERRIFTVSELTAELRGLIESSYPDVWIEGEISNCRVWNTGHVYFTLKDAGAQIKAVMFRTAQRYLRFTPEDGLHVLARGRLGVYDPKGEYQLVCEHMQPRGLGALQLAFEQLKKRLRAEGLFDASRKRPLPLLPAKIGIVTSLEGAALRDIIKVLRRRYPNAHLVIRPTRVQGDNAADDIARAVRAIGVVPGVDVVIVGRGGGSVEDLWSFNEEAVARAIASCPVPVIAAVGHEVDVTIADFVADLRAPTPSAAAELVVSAKDEVCARIDRVSARIRAAVLAGIQRRRTLVHFRESRRGLAGWHGRLALRGRHVADTSHQLRTTMATLLTRQRRELRTLQLRLDARDVRRHLEAFRGRLGTIDGRLRAAVRRRHDRAQSRLAATAARVETLSPLAVLGRGYAVCWNADRTAIVRHASGVTPGDRVHVTLHEGELRCTVTDTDVGKPRSSPQ